MVPSMVDLEWHQELDRETLRAMDKSGKQLRYYADACGVNVRVYEAWQSGELFPNGQQKQRLYGVLPRMKAYDLALAKAKMGSQFQPPVPEVPTKPRPAPKPSTVPPPAPAEEPQKLVKVERRTPPEVVNDVPRPETLTLVSAPGEPFNEALRRVRLALDMSQETIGKKIGVSKTVILEAEKEDCGRGISRKTYEDLVKLIPELANAAPPRRFNGSRPSRDNVDGRGKAQASWEEHLAKAAARRAQPPVVAAQVPPQTAAAEPAPVPQPPVVAAPAPPPPPATTDAPVSAPASETPAHAVFEVFEAAEVVKRSADYHMLEKYMKLVRAAGVPLDMAMRHLGLLVPTQAWTPRPAGLAY